jgi:hypothetical protein
VGESRPVRLAATAIPLWCRDCKRRFPSSMTNKNRKRLYTNHGVALTGFLGGPLFARSGGGRFGNGKRNFGSYLGGAGGRTCDGFFRFECGWFDGLCWCGGFWLPLLAFRGCCLRGGHEWRSGRGLRLGDSGLCDWCEIGDKRLNEGLFRGQCCGLRLPLFALGSRRR